MCPSGSHSSAQPRSDLRPAFDVLDTDRDGKISRDDLRTFYSGYDAATSDEDIGSMIWVADSNKDGFVQFDEFNQLLSLNQNHQHQTNHHQIGNETLLMEDVFRVMDRDGDGKVGFQDLKTYMSWAGFSATDEDIKTMIQLAGDENTADGLCYQDMLKVLAVDFAPPLY